MRFLLQRTSALAARVIRKSTHQYHVYSLASTCRNVNSLPFRGQQVQRLHSDAITIKHTSSPSVPCERQIIDVERDDESTDAVLTSAISNSSRPQLLPVSCPGCGALSQEVNPDEAGFYARSRKAIKEYFKKQALADQQYTEDAAAGQDQQLNRTKESSIESQANVNNDQDKLKSQQNFRTTQVQTPICDRCHQLVHNAKGHPIAHPSIEDLADSIAESPFKRNHVYHVIDAADFPMSLVTGIFKRLDLGKPRSQNRRSRHKITSKPTVSFIITRSDLLGPNKEAVDKLMPYFQNVLRTALGRAGRDIRLGNVHLVSAKRGWWTKDIKESIWERGGGNWMVGKVNVGKSNLFEVLFPKGSGDKAPVYAELQKEQELDNDDEYVGSETDFLAEDSLLPPAQPEVPFPAMPIVSNLPGTTASPIRLPFGNHRGELIDLPGLERGSLENHILPDHKLDLVMQHRPNVEQHIIKPGQSLLLGGGLVRITPLLDTDDRSTTMLAYPFVPIDAHVTATEKAIDTQQQKRESGIKSILNEGTGGIVSLAGTLDLNTDVTKVRAGALMRAGVNMSRLPFRVYSTDILIEGTGWVELVCQVRKRRPSFSSNISPTNIQPDEQSQEKVHLLKDIDITEPTFMPFSSQTSADGTITNISPGQADDRVPDFAFPQVEVFSPHGKHISQRQPLGAWLLWNEGSKGKSKTATAGRGRKSMSGVKRNEKTMRRAKAAVTV